MFTTFLIVATFARLCRGACSTVGASGGTLIPTGAQCSNAAGAAFGLYVYSLQLPISKGHFNDILSDNLQPEMQSVI
jgi:hypothetical protein